MKTLKILFIIFSILAFNINFAYSASGPATSYKITIRQIALCETGSTISSCLNPVVVFTGNSGEIDIASTTAGAAAASLGSAAEATIGTTYTYVQIVMDREMKIAAGTTTTINDGSNECKTDSTDTTASATADAVGSTTGDAGEQAVYAAVNGQAPGTTAFSAVSSITSTSATANAILSGQEFFQWRVVLASPFVYDGIQNPSVTVAFGTATAVSAHSSGGACKMYGSAPDVTITIN